MTNIILIGPMGAGKTVIGQHLAQRLSASFVDVDEYIENQANLKINQIFAKHGEAGFRKRETHVIRELLSAENTVIATGGGAVISAENRQCLQAIGFIVYLQTSVEQQLLRLSQHTNRPLLKTPDPFETLAVLAKQRQNYYQSLAQYTICTDNKRIDDISQQIYQVIKR